MPAPPTRDLITVEEAAEQLKVTTRTIYRWISDGTLPAHRLAGHLIRLDQASIDALIKPIPAVGQAGK